ncbi:hypothetical protein DNHGIG_25860 [Collibacillus ludicampi]|uniref:Phage tail protein n=1 Tax=Collibacillus ludicampi TaxID=2771369 RepID=A0AAV4LHX8_9BACL|nr:hypothetical protein [Collibacillus ludicampi]GIM47037.1 hypothetical protein DNHGIG_25860 [Collibacillus ludicampi]
MNVQIDPLQSITKALQDVFLPMGLKNVILGWPDTKFFTVDGNLPSLFIVQVNDSGKHLASRESIHATVPNSDGQTATVYKEKLRIFYLLQLSLFAYTQEDRSNLGWMIQQYLVSNPQLQIGIPGVETAVFKYRGQHNPPGETRYYQRDMNFEVTARVLDASTAYIAKTVVMNNQT